ncbi:histidine kinase [Paraoerskovia sediminicola]|uniref:histidine kinase n=1 Tax=Paraoerskovia sediminicola TaxID=1138587 RepID=A0ABM8G703_9CELL|nr:ATP-binding protein [Paraoerskovia sediminicola]BDZ43860.1 histidine kinase [Paraoerskovia sediminicola]
MVVVTARSVRRTLGRAFVAAGSALVLLLAVAAFALVRVVTLQEEVTVAYFDAITEASTVEDALEDADELLRSYVQTGDVATADVFATVTEGWGDLELPPGPAASDVTGAPDERLRLETQDAVRRWMSDYVVPVVATTQDPDGAVVPTVEQQRGHALNLAAQEAAADYVGALEEGRASAVDRLRTWTFVLASAVATLAVASVALSWWLWRVVDRRVTRPVHELAENVRRASVDRTLPVVVTGAGEVVDLSQDVERLRQDLVRRSEEAEDARIEVEASHQRLEQQSAELERSNRDLEQFAYVASHDLQEPLRKVASFTQLLRKRYGGQLDDRADQYIDFAVDGAKRMQRLIQDLLGFSRVGRSGAELADVDLEDALADALRDLAESLEAAGATVTHDHLPVVHGERALLTQLLLNVVGNAVKFRSPDRPATVHLGVRSDGTHWEISCTDNGIGIDPQYADRVFVIFQRLHAKDVYEGTGIGLALCKRIVEYHGGRIWIEAGETQGTVVRWTLAHRYVSAARELGVGPVEVD